MRHILLLSVSAVLFTQEANAEIWTFKGTLGKAKIGMTIDVADDKGDSVLGPRSHYFYNKYLQDISLKGRVSSESAFVEPSGGVFALHFTKKGSDLVQKRTLHTSNGMIGTWTKDGKVLPVVLGNDWVSSAGTSLYSDVEGVADAGVFERRIQDFRNAVLSDDRAAAMKFVNFPLIVNTAQVSRTIKDKAALTSGWDMVFPANWRRALVDVAPHDLFVHGGQAMIGNGMAWFDGTGLQSINLLSDYR